MGDAKNIIVKPISATDGNRIIRSLHYSGKVAPNSQLHFGVFFNGRCGGALQFGPSMAKHKMIGLVSGTLWNEFLELNRMAFADWLPRNGESRAISYCMRFIKAKYPHIKWVLSFADGTQCGDGTIYRASGFVLTQINSHTESFLLPNGESVQACSLRQGGYASWLKPFITEKEFHALRGGATASMRIMKAIGATKLSGFQLRYIYFLDPTAKDRLTVPILPFSEIERRGAGMYKGIKRVTKATSGDQLGGGGCVTSIDSDAPGDQLGERGASPTVTLQNNNEVPNAENP